MLRKSPGKSSAVLFDIMCLPPLSVLLQGEGLGLARLEFRRIKEFAELSRNAEGVKKVFDVFFESNNCDVTFEGLLEEIKFEHYE